jgi:flavin-dependent thymidylate synthase
MEPKMKVTLEEFTGSGWPDPSRRAAALLIFTKSTRLTMAPSLLDAIMQWPQEKIDQELVYMANTIPSSWEFVDYTFMINDVTRAFTHQFVRSRTWSFAQQTMRVLNVSEGRGWDYLTGPTLYDDSKRAQIYDTAMANINDAYKELIADGAAIEDARGVLPTNILTNIVAKTNMRNFVELVRKRSSPRVQGEYRDVLAAMIAAVRAVHPWIDLFVDRTFERAAKDLDAEIAAMTDKEQATRMLKLVDQMRAQS